MPQHFFNISPQNKFYHHPKVVFREKTNLKLSLKIQVTEQRDSARFPPKRDKTEV